MSKKFIVNGTPFQQPYLFAAPAATAGIIYGGELGNPKYGGFIEIPDRLIIQDPTPSTSGYYPGTLKKAVLNLSPNISIYSDNAPMLSSGHAYTGSSSSSFTSFNGYHPSSSGQPSGIAYTAAKHMSFMGFSPAVNGNIWPVSGNPTGFWNYAWNAPNVFPSWIELGSIQYSGYLGLTSYNTTSDYRLKHNITPLENGLDYILSLRPRKFTWKESEIDAIGFIAHEIQEDVPLDLSGATVSGWRDATMVYVNLYKDNELMLDENGDAIIRNQPEGTEADRLSLDGVTWKIVADESEMQSIDTNFMISPIVASIQELKKMFDVQKHKLDLIEKDVVEMEVI